MRTSLARTRLLLVPIVALAVVLPAGCVGVWPALFSGAATPTPDLISEEERRALEDARRAVDSDPFNFAGTYTGEPEATLYILFVGDDAASRERIAAFMPDDARVVWRQVSYSAAELGRISDEIVAMPSSNDLFSSIVTDTPNNRVLVALQMENPEVETQLRARFGNAVAFRVDPLPEPL